MAQFLRKRASFPPIVYILLALMLIFGIPRCQPTLQQLIQANYPLGDRIGLGEEILIASEVTPEKQAGVEAFARGDYKAAEQHFQASLQQRRNDPETVIYQNNTKVNLNGDRRPLRIAVSVPIGSNQNIAQEILRGVAQAQDEINSTGGINGRGLEVEIANDDNNPDIVRQIATTFVRDSEILGVIGHNASNATLAAAPIYQRGKLVMVTPTSFANTLSGFGNYIFRTAPNIQSMADALAKYVVKTARLPNVAVCYDSQAPDNVSFKDEFVASLSALGGNLIPTVCDLSAPTFNPNTAIKAAIDKGAEGLLVTPHIDRISQAIALTHANQGKLPLFSSPSLYTIQTLQQGKEDINGLVLPVPWHPQANPSSLFPVNARRLWGGNVSWRTATSYDATYVVSIGLQQSQTRDRLQQALSNPGFDAPGASEHVKFLPTGDRVSTPILVQVRPDATNGYAFAPLLKI